MLFLLSASLENWLPSSIAITLDLNHDCPVVDALAHTEHNQTDSAEDVETNENGCTCRNLRPLPPVSAMHWGPLGNSRRRYRLYGAIWNSVSGGSKRIEEASSDGKANAEYRATHVEDDDDEVQKEVKVYNGSGSVKVKEVSKCRTPIRTVSKTEKVLYTNEPGVPGIHRANSKLSLVDLSAGE